MVELARLEMRVVTFLEGERVDGKGSLLVLVAVEAVFVLCLVHLLVVAPPLFPLSLLLLTLKLVLLGLFLGLDLLLLEHDDDLLATLAGSSAGLLFLVCLLGG